MNSNLSINRINSINSYNNKYTGLKSNNPSFTHHFSKNDLSARQKAVILTTSTLGMAPVLAVLAKRKGFSLSPKRLLKTPIKDWAIFKSQPKERSIQFKAPQIMAVAAGSVAGGFVGGAIVDKKANRKAKQREILNQILGNVAVPVACVSTGAHFYDKYANKIESIMPQLKGEKKSIKILNKILKSVPNAVTTLGLLGIGIYLGNKVSNFINEKIYNKKVERNIKASDFAPHVDDLCMAMTVMNEDALFASRLARVIPLALLVPGYQTGIAQEH